MNIKITESSIVIEGEKIYYIDKLINKSGLFFITIDSYIYNFVSGIKSFETFFSGELYFEFKFYLQILTNQNTDSLYFLLCLDGKVLSSHKILINDLNKATLKVCKVIIPRRNSPLDLSSYPLLIPKLIGLTFDMAKKYLERESYRSSKQTVVNGSLLKLYTQNEVILINGHFQYMEYLCNFINKNLVKVIETK